MEIINAQKAPTAIGPYSHAVKINNMIFTSGQIPLDPATNKLKNSNISEATHQVFDNIEVILNASGSSLANIIKATIYISDLSLFDEMNAIYTQRLGNHKPARSCVEVSCLPKNSLIEIDVIAL